MAKIVEFKRREKKMDSVDRYKALSKGNIRTFICNTCGESIEVINGVQPERCPGCGLRISNWKRAEVNT